MPYNFLQRFIDICAAALGLLILSPFLFWIARMIRRDSTGPVFYRGARFGLGGKVFQILKFRTMYDNIESRSRVAHHRSRRSTGNPFGKFLRDTKLNELPQLWNVLNGEMSLVGPRPEDPEVATSWPIEVRQEVLSLHPASPVLPRCFIGMKSICSPAARSWIPTWVRSCPASYGSTSYMYATILLGRPGHPLLDTAGFAPSNWQVYTAGRSALLGPLARSDEPACELVSG